MKTEESNADNSQPGKQMLARGVQRSVIPGRRTARYDQFLPASQIRQYVEAVQDPDRLSLSEELALLRTRVQTLLDVNSGVVSEEHWANVGKAMAKMRKGLLTSSTNIMRQALGELDAAVDAGMGQAETWKEIGSTMDRIRRLAESERNLVVTFKMMMDRDEAAQLVAFMAEQLRVVLADNLPQDVAGQILKEYGMVLEGRLADIENMPAYSAGTGIVPENGGDE